MIKVSTHNQKIIDTIYAHGGFPYFVGGCVRDHLMNIEPKDKVNGTVDQWKSHRFKVSGSVGSTPTRAIISGNK